MSELETVALSITPLAGRRSKVNDKNLSIMLVSQTWAFGPDDKGPRLGRMRFLEDGMVGDYKHANKRRWIVSNNVLTFMTDIGVPTSRFILLFGGSNPVLLGKSAENQSIRYFINDPRPLRMGAT